MSVPGRTSANAGEANRQSREFCRRRTSSLGGFCIRVFVAWDFAVMWRRRRWQHVGGGGTGGSPTVFSNYHLTGVTTPVRDPSIALQTGTYYVFSTDAGLPGPGSLPIFCSKDRMVWGQCGVVFQQIPAWVHQQVPLATGPVGAGHFVFQRSLPRVLCRVFVRFEHFGDRVGDERYAGSHRSELPVGGPRRDIRLGTTDDFNAIDPTILVDSDGSVWMTYGSFWSGIKQRQIDPTTGELRSDRRFIRWRRGRE